MKLSASIKFSEVKPSAARLTGPWHIMTSTQAYYREVSPLLPCSWMYLRSDWGCLNSTADHYWIPPSALQEETFWQRRQAKLRQMAGVQTTDQSTLKHADQENIYVASSGDRLQLEWKVALANPWPMTPPCICARAQHCCKQPFLSRCTPEECFYCRGATSHGQRDCPSSVYRTIVAQATEQRLSCTR